MPRKRNLKVVKLPKRKELSLTEKRLITVAREMVDTYALEGFFIMGWDKEGDPVGAYMNSDDSRFTSLLLPTLTKEMARALMVQYETREILGEILELE